jgi:Queuosine salvage protein
MNTLLNLQEAERGVGVLSSTAPVVEAARHVWIDERGLQALYGRLEALVRTAGSSPDRYAWCQGARNKANQLLLLHAWNFSFWSARCEARWTVDIEGTKLNGYKALTACLRRARERGTPLEDAKYLSKLSLKDLRRILKGSVEIPLLHERLKSAREVGRVLLRDWDGDFNNLIQECDGSAVSLVEMIAENFSSFNDVTTYYGRDVKFFKRAQILVSDLAGLSLEPSFHDLDRLTAFADYKIPQVLEALQVLRYSPALASQLDQEGVLTRDDSREVEIRAATVWAVELARQALRKKGLQVNAPELDWILWNLGQEPVDRERPYHRTRTIFY